MASSSPAKVLWTHPDPTSTSIYKFKSHISSKYAVPLETYEELYQWSIRHIPEFWSEVATYTSVIYAVSPTISVDPTLPMFPRAPWFPGAKLNFAENLLFPKGVTDTDVAVISATEEDRVKLSWRDLRELVRACAAALKGKIYPGDRVVGYVGNHVEALVAMLATTSLGGVWSGVSPDHGATAVLDRWGQLEPTVLFADNAVFYNGREHDSTDKIAGFVKQLPSLKHIVVFPKFLAVQLEKIVVVPGARKWLYEDFILSAKIRQRPLEFVQLDADWPVYILFSSGTTGKPKCIVHGAVGTLIQHKKEHVLQCDMKPGDVFFQFTTVTWMMWHWLVSGLASGATIVLYDGSPFRPQVNGSGDLAMAALIDEFKVTHFGTSAKYLSILEQNNAAPKELFSLSTLKAIYSTAAPLAPSTFEYIYRAFGPNVNLGSITGGTDIISLFGAPSPLKPVIAGEIQCLGLGMAVESWDAAGKPTDDAGDLVCTKPFPCMPVSFFGPTGFETYRKSYFDMFPNVWHHGDYIRIVPETRGLLMLGRSDGMLKPAGVRFGSAEIYNLVLAHFAADVEDSLCVGRRREGDSDEVVVLFVKLLNGAVIGEVAARIRETVNRELSARHVPTFVVECAEIPVTTNGKKVEVAVKQILSGRDVKVSASVANPECLEFYREWARDN